MTRKQPTPVPPGAIKPALPPAPPLRSEPVYAHECLRCGWDHTSGPCIPIPPSPIRPLRSEPVYSHEGVEIPRPGAVHEIEEALRQLVEALPDLYDEVGEGAVDAIRHAQRVLGIEVEEEEPSG